MIIFLLTTKKYKSKYNNKSTYKNNTNNNKYNFYWFNGKKNFK